MVHLVGLNCNNRSCEVILLDGTVTDDHDVLKDFRILLQGDIHYRTGSYCNRLEAHERDGQLAALRCRNSKITVEVRGGAAFLSDNTDGSAHDGFAGIILDITFDLYLCKGAKRDEKPTN